MATNVRDPRSIITPDAFGIDPDLLGTPLARPWPRLWALLIDITVIGVLNVFTSGLGAFIWTVVGLFLLRMAFRGPAEGTSPLAANLSRGATGCLGGLILLIVGLVGLGSALTRDDQGRPIDPGVAVQTLSRLGAFDELREELADAEDAAAAEEVLAEALEIMDGLDLDRETRIEALDALIPEELELGGEREAFIEDLVGRTRSAEPQEEAAPEATIPDSVQEEVDSLPFAEALTRYAQAVRDGDRTSPSPQLRALEARIRTAVASDTLEALEVALSEESRSRSRAESRAASATEELARRNSGFVALLRDIWDQAGSAVGLWSIYFTVIMTLTNGFTVGKRILGLRVLRLDGEPLTWWASFERAGGYVAGIATGLLGFAQIFWDPNRQCVHDKIGRTVVVVAGAAPVAGAVEGSWKDADGAGAAGPARPGGS